MLTLILWLLHHLKSSNYHHPHNILEFQLKEVFTLLFSVHWNSEFPRMTRFINSLHQGCGEGGGVNKIPKGRATTFHVLPYEFWQTSKGHKAEKERKRGMVNKKRLLPFLLIFLDILEIRQSQNENYFKKSI